MSTALVRSIVVAFLAGLGLSVAGQTVNGVELALIAAAQLAGHVVHHLLLAIWHAIRKGPSL